MAAQGQRPEPYLRRDPNDVIRAGDWNDLQVQAREEIHTHTHSGGDDGKPIPRAGIQDAAIDGSKVDPQADLRIANLRVSGKLEVLGEMIARDVEHHGGDVQLGDEDSDAVTVKGVVRSSHSSGALMVDDALRISGEVRVGAAGTSEEVVINEYGQVGIGTSTPEHRLHVNGAISGFGIVPIGSIIAWHQDLPRTPPLPEGWKECNGQVVYDNASPYRGQRLPNLNGERRFIRGSLTSETPQDQMFEDHLHRGDQNGTVHYQDERNGVGPGFTNWHVPYVAQQSNPRTAPTGGAISGSYGGETRPINMSMVWIMRIK